MVLMPTCLFKTFLVLLLVTTGNNGLDWVSRAEWKARMPLQPLPPLKAPVKYIIISHTASSSCSTRFMCSVYVRNIQTYHMATKKMWDIAYNFLVGGNGYVYVGRGWAAEGSHTKYYNGKGMGIALIGGYLTILPPKKQIQAVQELIKYGVDNGYIAKDYKLVGASQVTATLSPGKRLFEDIQDWPNWEPNP